MNKPRGKATPTAPKAGWPGCRLMRDVLLASINKGQFPIACVFFLMLTILIRLPKNDLSNFVKDVVNKLENWYITGWVFFTIVLFCWFFNTRHLRKIHTKEMARIAGEKKELQQKLAGKKLPSSNKKR